MPVSQWGNIIALGQGSARGVLTLDTSSESIVWESTGATSGGGTKKKEKAKKKLEVPKDSVLEIHWRGLPSGSKLTLKLDGGAIALFYGFPPKALKVMQEYFKTHCDGKEVVQSRISAAGLHCGSISIVDNELILHARAEGQASASNVGETEGESEPVGDEIVSLNLSRVKNCAVPVHHELEVQCDTDDIRGEEEMCDMIRFFVPEVEGKEDADAICEQVKALTNASSGDVIFEFSKKVGSFMTPRGKYSIEMYKEHLRLHGTTYAFQIQYTDIIKLYLLPDPKSPSQFLVFCLREGVQQGRQLYNYLVLKLKEEEQLVHSEMKQAQLDEHFGTTYNETTKRNEPNLLETNNDFIYKIVAKCFHFVARVKVFKTSNYMSSQNFPAIGCAVGSGEGLLYPLAKGLMYLHKPVLLIPYKSIVEVWLLRLHDKNLLHTFDLEVTYVDNMSSKQEVTFKNINKKESMNLQEFLRKKKVRIKTKRSDGPEMVNSSIIEEQLGPDSDENSSDDEAYTEADANAAVESSSDSEADESSEDEAKPTKKRSKKSGRAKRKRE